MSLLYFVIVILILLYFVIVCGEPVQKINSYLPSPSEFTCGPRPRAGLWCLPTVSRQTERPCEPTKCSIKWSCSCLLSLRVWKSLKTGQIVKMKTILVQGEGKRCARSPLPLPLLFPPPMRSWHFVSLPVPLKKRQNPILVVHFQLYQLYGHAQVPSEVTQWSYCNACGIGQFFVQV